MKLVDVHSHLDFPDYSKDLNEVLERAKKKGVKSIIANGINPESNRKTLDIAKKYSFVKPALGLYPDDVYDYKDEEIDGEIDFIKKNKEFVALGEVGLDGKFSDEKNVDEKKRRQREVFQKFIELSEKTKKPLIIHSRKAELDVIEMLESSNVKNPVLHAFMGRKKYVQRAADNGYNFSILPIITKLQQLQQLVEYTNINQLLTETDSPYMNPTGERNEPSNVSLAVNKIAELKGFEKEEVANNIFMNYQRLI